ncbi:MAG: ppx/GppA phosphatase family protein [Burkholderiaceae bacterium]|nr:ppx/GppA phosphatase family protein [Burkholderiaceae bacterium]
MLAAIDLGSNSFRLHVGQHDGEKIAVVASAREPTRLAAGLDQAGYLTHASMDRAMVALERLGEVLRQHPLDDVRAVATNTMRIAGNAAEFLPVAEKALGCPIEIISGEEEARLIYLGIANQLATPGERRLVIDIGGGSTELILGCGKEIERAESIGIGTVQQSMTFFPDGRIDASAFEQAILYARSRFEDVFSPQQKPWKNVYGSSGTMRAIAEIISRNNLGDGEFSRVSMEALKEKMIAFGRIDRLEFDKLRPDRVESLVGGLSILLGLTQEMDIDALSPIEGGLRLGVMWDLHLRATQRDRREQSVRSFLQRFAADESRANQVADYALALYGQLKPGTDAFSKLLRWSAVLHEVGLAVSPTNYHKHGAYLIENADLPGFTTREQRTMGRFILGQKGNLRKLDGALNEPDIAKAVLALRLAVMFMHSRIDVDVSEMRVKMKNRIDLEFRLDQMSMHPTLPYWIEQERKFWGDVGMIFNVKTRG